MTNTYLIKDLRADIKLVYGSELAVEVDSRDVYEPDVRATTEGDSVTIKLYNDAGVKFVNGQFAGYYFGKVFLPTTVCPLVTITIPRDSEVILKTGFGRIDVEPAMYNEQWKIKGRAHIVFPPIPDSDRDYHLTLGDEAQVSVQSLGCRDMTLTLTKEAMFDGGDITVRCLTIRSNQPHVIIKHLKAETVIISPIEMPTSFTFTIGNGRGPAVKIDQAEIEVLQVTSFGTKVTIDEGEIAHAQVKADFDSVVKLPVVTTSAQVTEGTFGKVIIRENRGSRVTTELGKVRVVTEPAVAQPARSAQPAQPPQPVQPPQPAQPPVPSQPRRPSPPRQVYNSLVEAQGDPNVQYDGRNLSVGGNTQLNLNLGSFSRTFNF